MTKEMSMNRKTLSAATKLLFISAVMAVASYAGQQGQVNVSGSLSADTVKLTEGDGSASVGTESTEINAQWVSAKEKWCWQVCNEKDLKPVASGTYSDGNTFLVCRANTENEGSRAGFNLAAKWAEVCSVGYG